MVRFGQTSQHTARSAAVPGWAGIGTSTLREMSADSRLSRPALLDQHVLILVTVGHGTYEVDFQPYQCRPGTLILVRPGQLVRTEAAGGLDAVVLCWADDVLDRLAPEGHRFAPTHWQLAGEDQDAVINEVSQLVVDCQRHRGGQLAADLLRHQLTVLLLRLALLPSDPTAPPSPQGATRPAAPPQSPGSATRSTAPPQSPGSAARSTAPPSAESATYLRLREEIEQHYRGTRRVEDYAAWLGCSVRTLTRACLAATGRSAKQLVDDRVALQARRLLAATDEPVADIGRRLGFPEPTNFGRFFQREVGQSPGAFRAGLGRVEPRAAGGAVPAEGGSGGGRTDPTVVAQRVPGQRPVGPGGLLAPPPRVTVVG
ncbi:helix-turn-helix domain-containing protein [Micromonospora sp. NPDC050397]|uniref:helix-turn-helix domain-containing protein n=1 Tax=Micromonospora sp. NPDC050397 TaxID=3364279 RepID=UPI00384C6208